MSDAPARPETGLLAGGGSRAASPACVPPTAIEWRYYLAMCAPFGIDTVVSAIFTGIHGLPGLFVRNLVIDGVVLLVGMHLIARGLFRPIHRFLAGEVAFPTIERRLTQLPLLSAVAAVAIYTPIILFRTVIPLIFDFEDAGLPAPTWVDALATLVVQTAFMFVVMYFLVSGYLEQLCNSLFQLHGVNLGLFFGRFFTKLVVAFVFGSAGPVFLVAAEIWSYQGDRLMREVAVDLVASCFGLAVTLYWVSRSLTRPLRRLEQGMDRVAGGDLRVRLPVTSNEEIGEITARFNQMTEGLLERQRIRETFGKYVSESVASALMREAGDDRLRGETREATLMFTDIEGFTALSERLPPDTLIAVLNEYLETVLAPIQKHGGVVNSFIGDGIFASFNMPLANERHARSAIAAAAEIQHALRDRVFAGGVRLATRIGVNSGTVIGGTIGAGERLSYTLLGDAVNTAARLQELNKTYGTRILVTETTRLAAGDGWRFARIGEVPIRGRSGGLLLHSIDF